MGVGSNVHQRLQQCGPQICKGPPAVAELLWHVRIAKGQRVHNGLLLESSMLQGRLNLTAHTVPQSEL